MKHSEAFVQHGQQCPVCGKINPFGEYRRPTDPDDPWHLHPETYTEEEKKLAEEIHERECKADHTEGCAWFYDTWHLSITRHKYIQMARKELSKRA